ncbi:MAG: phenylalanine--tRNA ligase subunit beta, partial [Chitinispirillaceae bacterium]|nr:phenylalanine--tRNA ligase subunit beta [Chitinispirillaceae bacterium]
MKIVYSWLKDFIDISLTPEEETSNLTSIGNEFSSLKKRSIPAGVVVAKIVEIEKHPNADKLTFCKVDIGDGKILPIVCGAPNVKKEMISALATIGTKISEDFTIKKAKIRGVESEGMLCSAKELGISEDHSGIIELPIEMEVGKPLSYYYPDDAIIEIELTPNRGDCLSVIGVARELAAKFGLKLKNTAKKPIEEESKIEEFISVELKALRECPRYTGRLIRGVKVKPSPNWLAQRLIMAGLRPINNVVDITNYILLEFGQPMHAFDYSKIYGKRIIVKLSEKSQKIKTLDGIEREILPEDLLITDAERPVALAGIMGGEGSEITDETTDVFLECAYFDPITIRKTSRRLGLITDSSYRFERGVDPERGLIDALDTAAAMIAELGEGKVTKGIIDIYPTKLTPKK